MFTKLNCLIRLNKKTLAACLIVLFVLEFPVLTANSTNSECSQKCEKAFNDTDVKLQRIQENSGRVADKTKEFDEKECTIEFDRDSLKCTTDYVGETNKCYSQWIFEERKNAASYNQAVHSAHFSFSYGVTQGPQYASATNSAANKYEADRRVNEAQLQKCLGDRGAELTRCNAIAKTNYDSCVAKAENKRQRARYAAYEAYLNSRSVAEDERDKCMQKCDPSS